eukprot:1828417-Pyramimonas_sp.AAC.1
MSHIACAGHAHPTLTAGDARVRRGSGGSTGGGIAIATGADGNSSVTLLNTTVQRNVAGVHGGGVSVMGHGPVNITGCVVSDNICGGAGGGVRVMGGNVWLGDTLLEGNQ